MARFSDAAHAALSANFPTLSRNRVKRWLKDGVVFYDGRRVSDRDVAPRDFNPSKLELRGVDPERELNERAMPSAKPFVRVIHEDSELLVLDKPSGVPSVPHSGDELDTAVNSALASCPALSGVGSNPLEPGLAHRLDTGTSGALVFAKSNAELERLRSIWKLPPPEGVRKIYRALCIARDESVLGRLGQGPVEITTRLAHSDKSAKRMLADTGKHQKIRGEWLEAHTRILSAHRVAGSTWDLEIEIRTGVMHQIRCHLASLGLPIVGDEIYGGAKAPRLMLHAWKIYLPREIVAPLPNDWRNCVIV